MSLVIYFEDIPDEEDYTFELVEKPGSFQVDPEEGILK